MKFLERSLMVKFYCNNTSFRLPVCSLRQVIRRSFANGRNNDFVYRTQCYQRANLYDVLRRNSCESDVVQIALVKDPLKCFRNSAAYLVGNLA